MNHFENVLPANLLDWLWSNQKPNITKANIHHKTTIIQNKHKQLKPNGANLLITLPSLAYHNQQQLPEQPVMTNIKCLSQYQTVGLPRSYNQCHGTWLKFSYSLHTCDDVIGEAKLQMVSLRSQQERTTKQRRNKKSLIWVRIYHFSKPISSCHCKL